MDAAHSTENYRQTPRRPSRAFTLIVLETAAIRIFRNTHVEGIIGTTEDVAVMHRGNRAPQKSIKGPAILPFGSSVAFQAQ